MSLICCSDMRWRLGCMPSRNVMSWRMMVLPCRFMGCSSSGDGLGLQHLLCAQLGSARGGGGHDVQVAGVLRKVIAQALDLQEHRDAAVVEHRPVDEAVARH